MTYNVYLYIIVLRYRYIKETNIVGDSRHSGWNNSQFAIRRLNSIERSPQYGGLRAAMARYIFAGGSHRIDDPMISNGSEVILVTRIVNISDKETYTCNI